MSQSTSTTSTGTVRKGPLTKSKSSKQSTNKSRNYVTTTQVFGGKFSPPANPPDVTFQPWFRCTLVDPFQSTVTVTVDHLKHLLRKQLDPLGRGFNPSDSGDKRFVPQFKIHTIQAWNLTGHIISISVQDFTDTQSARGGRDQLAGIVDTGSPGLLPKVGFRLPASHRAHVLRADDIESQIEIAALQVGAHDQGLLYVSIEFRFDGSTTLPTCKSLFDILSTCYISVNDIRTTTNSDSKTLSGVSDTVSLILERMSTLTNPAANDVLRTIISQLRLTTIDEDLKPESLSSTDSFDIVH